MLKKLRKISIEDLTTGMTIHSYDGFDSRYENIDRQTLVFLRHNFRDTSIIVNRKGIQKKIVSQRLRVNDTIVRIFEFPPSLEKITTVSNGLIKELKKRGLTRFSIEQNTSRVDAVNTTMRDLLNLVEKDTKLVNKRPISASSNRNSQNIQRISELVEKVSQGIEVKEKVARQIEKTMDTARRGKVSLVNIKQNLKILHASSEAMTVIISLKESKMAYEHSLDVAVLFKTIYTKMAHRLTGRSPFQSEDDMLMAGILHDIGKSKIPKCILHNADELSKNSRELQIMRSHPYLGAKLLEDLNLPDIMVNMAWYHHVKKTPSMINSYPRTVNWKDVAFETRLMTVVDIYQSLVGRRNYKKSWAPNSAIKFISALSGVEFDLKAWSIFHEAMGAYPVGSMVQLNDGSLGFVMNPPEKARQANRPVIAVTRNGSGEDLTHPHIIDLQIERDFRITKEVDCYSIYGKNAVNVFSSMRVA